MRHITYDSRSVDSKVVGARILMEAGKPAEAMALLRENVWKSPSDFRSWHLLGVCQIRLGDEAWGKRSLKKCLELNPYNGPSYLWLAKVERDKKEQNNFLLTVLVMEERGTPSALEAMKRLNELKRE